MADEVMFVQPTDWASNGEALHRTGQHVIFSVWKEPQPFASEMAGHPVFKEVEMVEYFTGGDNLTIPKFKVTDYERRAFRAQYEAFKDSRAQVPDGTLMSFLYPGSPDIVEMLAGMKLYTVEALAELTDGDIQRIPMGGYEMRAKAQKFLATAKDSGRFHSMEHKLQEEKFEREKQNAIIDKLNAKLAAMEAREELAMGLHDDVGPAPKRRGRPPRVQVEDAGGDEAAA